MALPVEIGVMNGPQATASAAMTSIGMVFDVCFMEVSCEFNDMNRREFNANGPASKAGK
ncbi:hypothetical protein [Stappia indica]|uniref:hypothetical protein n=1 Tax=Stappia indica TaxID=538381 RepID=UPI001495EFF2|nr:hypothetical protein [Stappia indica]MCC4246193.1 hypothetical protein [Stappia indica]